MSDERRTHDGLMYLVTAVSRLNVALQGQFLGGVREAQEISELLRKALASFDEVEPEVPDAD